MSNLFRTRIREAVERLWVFVPEALATDPPSPITRTQVPIPGMIQPGQAVVVAQINNVLGIYLQSAEKL
jgi:hypothetical protein